MSIDLRRLTGALAVLLTFGLLAAPAASGSPRGHHGRSQVATIHFTGLRARPTYESSDRSCRGSSGFGEDADLTIILRGRHPVLGGLHDARLTVAVGYHGHRIGRFSADYFPFGRTAQGSVGCWAMRRLLAHGLAARSANYRFTVISGSYRSNGSNHPLSHVHFSATSHLDQMIRPRPTTATNLGPAWRIHGQIDRWTRVPGGYGWRPAHLAVRVFAWNGCDYFKTYLNNSRMSDRLGRFTVRVRKATLWDHARRTFALWFGSDYQQMSDFRIDGPHRIVPGGDYMTDCE